MAGFNEEDFLNSKVSSIREEPKEEVSSFEKLSAEDFKELSKVVEEIRKKIAAGNQASLDEAKLITVWFRARRAENFTVAAAKAKAAKKPAAPKKKKVLKSVERQNLGDALLNTL